MSHSRYPGRRAGRDATDPHESGMTVSLECPLCRVTSMMPAVRGGDKRDYHLCRNCMLIFADPRHRLGEEEERKHYATHENSIANNGYVDFLNRLVEPLLPWLTDDMRGLDYGCGPGPTLSTLLRRYGIECEDYDPLFAVKPLQPPYDFITSTECFEHFHRPGAEIGRIVALLRPGGLLGIMTELWSTLPAFANWHYTRDPTHVSFFHSGSFDFIYDRFNLVPLWMDDRQVTILQKRRA